MNVTLWVCARERVNPVSDRKIAGSWLPGMLIAWQAGQLPSAGREKISRGMKQLWTDMEPGYLEAMSRQRTRWQDKRYGVRDEIPMRRNRYWDVTRLPDYRTLFVDRIGEADTVDPGRLIAVEAAVPVHTFSKPYRHGVR